LTSTVVIDVVFLQPTKTSVSMYSFDTARFLVL